MNKRRLLNVRCFRFCFVCMVVVVERTQGFVLHDLESKSLRDPLNGQVAKLLKFEFIHDVLSRIRELENSYIIHQTSDFFRYSSVFEYSPVWFE